MPRTSLRAEALNRIDGLTIAAMKHHNKLKLFGISTAAAEDFVVKCRQTRYKIQCQRCIKRGPYRKRNAKFHLCLEDNHADSLDDKEFTFHFRLSGDCFWQLVSHLKDHEAFKRKTNKGKAPRSPEEQMLVLLKFYGCEGNSGASLPIGNFFGVASGAVDFHRKNALDAVLSLEDRTYFWPTVDERKAISSRIKEQYMFPNCAGLIDGTLLPLAFRPITHGENYFSRKCCYSIVMLAVCDDQGRILYHHVGWPGSVHDNRVWRNCKLRRHHSSFFSPKEHSLGDSAFTASAIMIPPFKSCGKGDLQHNHAAFNKLLAKPRVKSEHCIGMMKGRFPFLRGIRMRLKTKADMKKIVKHVRGAVVLHNFLIKDKIDDEWMSDTDEEALLEEDGESAASGEVCDTADYKRRNELLYCLSELQETSIN